MTKIIKFGFGIYAFPTIILITLGLVNLVLNDTVIEILGNIMGYVDKIIGTTNTNYILITVTVILLVKIAKWFIGLINGNGD